MSAALKKKGTISFGGFITSLARAIRLDTKLATIEPIPPRTLDLNLMRHMRRCKVRKEGGYHLMVRNHEIKSIVLPWPTHTDVRERENWIYDLQASPYTGPMPMDIPQNVNVDDVQIMSITI